jgi:subtilisin family serine protease
VTNSLAVSNALASARDAGIIVVAACGNTSTNLDVNPTYPTGFHLANVVSVASTTQSNALASTSNYGANSVHLAAPGEQIYSTFAASDSFYLSNSGTSFAAPYVTGALALMLAKYPTEDYSSLINRLLAGTDPLPALAGKCVTSGRLNLRNALSPPVRVSAVPVPPNSPFQLRVSAGPNRTCIIQGSMTLTNWFPVFTNTTSTNGTFDYIDTNSTNVPWQFYRAVSTL